jgi:hypothetical protein
VTKMNDWPFADPRNVAVFTVRSVWQSNRPILFVYHNEDDGAWQFHADRTPNEKEASIVSLEEIAILDPSVTELADLPIGWCAWRTSREGLWHREKVT